MTGITQVHQVTTPSPPFLISAMVSGSGHCHHLRLLDFYLSMAALSRATLTEWNKKKHHWCHPKYMSHEYWLLMIADCWFFHVWRDMNIALKTDMDQACLLILLYPQNWMEGWTPKIAHISGFVGLNFDLSGPKPRTRGHGTQFLLICLDTLRWAIWMQSGSRAASNLTHPHMEAQAGRWQRTHLKNNLTRISIVHLYHIISIIHIIYVIRYVC